MSDPMMPSGGSPPPRRDRRRDVRLVLTGVVAVLLVWFALINLQDVTMHWIVGTTHTPLIVLVAICLLIGAGVGFAAGRRSRTTTKSDG